VKNLYLIGETRSGQTYSADSHIENFIATGTACITFHNNRFRLSKMRFRMNEHRRDICTIYVRVAARWAAQNALAGRSLPTTGRDVSQSACCHSCFGTYSRQIGITAVKGYQVKSSRFSSES